MRKGQKIVNENFKQLKLENDMLKEESLEMKKNITELKVRTEEFERREEKNKIIVKGLKVRANSNEVMKEMEISTLLRSGWKLQLK